MDQLPSAPLGELCIAGHHEGALHAAASDGVEGDDDAGLPHARPAVAGRPGTASEVALGRHRPPTTPPFHIFSTKAAAATELSSRLATRATGASGRQGSLRGAAALRFSLGLRPSLDPRAPKLRRECWWHQEELVAVVLSREPSSSRFHQDLHVEDMPPMLLVVVGRCSSADGAASRAARLLEAEEVRLATPRRWCSAYGLVGVRRPYGQVGRG